MRWSLNWDVLDSVKPVLKPAKARHIDVMKVLLGQEWAPPEEDALAESWDALDWASQLVDFDWRSPMF